jgi:hypothetical protein
LLLLKLNLAIKQNFSLLIDLKIVRKKTPTCSSATCRVLDQNASKRIVRFEPIYFVKRLSEDSVAIFGNIALFWGTFK